MDGLIKPSIINFLLTVSKKPSAIFFCSVIMRLKHLIWKLYQSTPQPWPPRIDANLPPYICLSFYNQRSNGLVCQVTEQYRIMELLFMYYFFHFFIFFNTNHQNILTFFTFYITSIIFYYHSNKKIHYNLKLFYFFIQIFFYFISHHHFLLIPTITTHYYILFCTYICQTNSILRGTWICIEFQVRWGMRVGHRRRLKRVWQSIKKVLCL